MISPSLDSFLDSRIGRPRRSSKRQALPTFANHTLVAEIGVTTLGMDDAQYGALLMACHSGTISRGMDKTLMKRITYHLPQYLAVIVILICSQGGRK